MDTSQNNSQDWSQLLALAAANWPPRRWRDVGIVIGCSGGADSVALLRLMADIRVHGDSVPRGFLIAAHFNHRLRGQESDDDQQFVDDLANELGVAFHSARTTSEETSEAALRTERMKFLIETAKTTGARYVAVAHSADDNAETVLHHLLRGTGPAGLAGIGNTRPIDRDLVLMRPLLNASRQHIREALRSISQTWREDSSNSEVHYQRNWIRQQLLPLIETRYPHAVDAINRAIDGQREWRSFVDRRAKEWLDEHHLAITQPGPETRPETNLISLSRDDSTDRVVVVAAMQKLWTEVGWPRGEMSREHWTRLAQTIRSNTFDRYSLPGRVDIDATKSVILLSVQKPDQPPISVQTDNHRVPARRDSGHQ